MVGGDDKVRSSVRISVLGLGKLGVPFAACLASKGFRVVGVDVDLAKVKLVNQGLRPVFEPGLKELMLASQERLRATEDEASAVRDSEITFILLPTPSEQEGGFSLSYILPACKRIGQALRQKSAFHLIVVTSTVLPGSTGGKVRQALEEHSGKKCGEGFGLCYNPEFVALGSVIRDLLNPDFVLIGESDRRSGDLLSSVYKTFCDNDPTVVRMNFINAEVTKLAVNTFVTTKIAFANMLARICERLPGADVDTVTSALARDNRIGGKYLKGAIGYGGPCFPRDNLALAFLARQVGVPATLTEATDRANRNEVQSLVSLITSRLPSERGSVGILGLAYKPNTDVVDESQGLLLAQALLAQGICVSVYDPVAIPNAKKVLGKAAIFAASAADCIKAAQVVVLVTPWEDFRGLSPDAFQSDGMRKVLVDCWRFLEPKSFDSIVEYVPLGVGPGNEAGIVG
jgi:UDPglucose 6-dehydrogenase